VGSESVSKKAFKSALSWAVNWTPLQTFFY